jgi:hypothetical protein
MACAAGRLQAQARRTGRGSAALRSGVSNAGEGKKFPCYREIRHDRTAML